MKDEIKEILEYVLSLTYGNENAIKGINKVEDYITNLQEKIKILTRKLKQHEKCRRKQQQSLMKHLEDYKSRNEKAIEYIKNRYYKEEYEREGTFTNGLMKILQGSDKDE